MTADARKDRGAAGFTVDRPRRRQADPVPQVFAVTGGPGRHTRTGRRAAGNNNEIIGNAGFSLARREAIVVTLAIMDSALWANPAGP